MSHVALVEIAEGVWSTPENDTEVTVVLLHGWLGTATANFGAVIDPLSRWARVVAIDLAGHGDGPRRARYDNPADIAEHVAACIATHCDGPVVVVGFSLGGAVAQQLCHDHPELVGGAVFAGTASHLWHGWLERQLLGGLGRLGHLGAPVLRTVGGMNQQLGRAVTGRFGRRPPAGLFRHDWAAVAAIGAAMAVFDSRRWSAELTLPTAVIVCQGDRVIGEARQEALARDVAAVVFVAPGGHLGFWRHPAAFAGVLDEACRDVAQRAGLGRAPIGLS